MKRVTLIVTGEVEKKALDASLGRLFPEATFETQMLGGFTSERLPAEPRLDREKPGLVQKLAAALVAAVDPGRNGTPADLAFLIDDLELVNAEAPERAIHHIREAVRADLEARWPNAARRARSAGIVRQRCSFHLLSPMVEAYFFGEPAALTRAGATRPAKVDPSARDLERFEVDDPDFLAPPNARHPVWAKAHRGRHPKCYLQFLCDPAGQGTRSYRETKGGYEALRKLDWKAVLVPPLHVQFARAMLADLADGLNRYDLVAELMGLPHPLTSRAHGDNLLRNV